MLPITIIQNNLLPPKLAFGAKKSSKKAAQAQTADHSLPKAVQAPISFKTLSAHADGVYAGICKRAEALIEKYPHARHCITNEIIAAINRGSQREQKLKRIQQLDKEKREKAEKKLGQKCAKNDAFMAIADLENRLNPKTQIISQSASTTATATRQSSVKNSTQQQQQSQPPSSKKAKAEKRRQALIQKAIRATGLSREALNQMTNGDIANEIKVAPTKEIKRLMKEFKITRDVRGKLVIRQGETESDEDFKKRIVGANTFDAMRFTHSLRQRILKANPELQRLPQNLEDHLEEFQTATATLDNMRLLESTTSEKIQLQRDWINMVRIAIDKVLENDKLQLPQERTNHWQPVTIIAKMPKSSSYPNSTSEVIPVLEIGGRTLSIVTGTPNEAISKLHDNLVQEKNNWLKRFQEANPNREIPPKVLKALEVYSAAHLKMNEAEIKRNEKRRIRATAKAKDAAIKLAKVIQQLGYNPPKKP